MNWFGRRLTLRVSLLSSLSILLAISLSLLVWYSYSSNSRDILKISEDLIDQISLSVHEKTVNFFKPAGMVVEIGRELISECKSQSLKLEQFQLLMKQFFVDSLLTNPQLHFVYYADQHGNYLGVEKIPNGQLVFWNIVESIPGELRRWEFHYLDQNYQIERTELIEEFDYFAPGRPWYKIAQKNQAESWTDVYAFFSAEAAIPGITCSNIVTVDNEFIGVFAADLVLKDISLFLKQLEIGQNGLAFIVNSQDKVVAFPDLSIISTLSTEEKNDENNEEPALPIAGHLNIPWLDSAYNEHLLTGQEDFTHQFDQQRYIVSIQPLDGVLDDDWKIVVAVPEDDFVGAMKQTNRNIIIVGLIVMALTFLVIILITNWVSRPIMKMVNHTQKISQLYLDEPLNFYSPIYEVGILSESMEKMRKGLLAFGKFVPVTLIRRLMISGQELTIGGNKKNLTIFFSDIQGFTSITENMEAESLMVHISEYLEMMTSLIVNRGGTIDKYIGDGIMAFWGAPEENFQHADFAGLAALECLQKVQDLNLKWEEAGKPRLETRIGIASGLTIVGNLGSSDRINYSVIGDAVNLASRLEGINKSYHTSILISQSTFEQLSSEKFILRPVDLAQIRGKTGLIKVYELMAAQRQDGTWIHPGFKSVTPKNLKNLSEGFHQVLNLYLDRHWSEAISLLEVIRQKFPEDLLIEDFLKRCQYWIDNPPPTDWNGIRPGFRTNDEIH